MRVRRCDRGFTLIEFAVVMSIIALLAVLAAPRLFSAFSQGAQVRVQKDLRTIQDALERHYTDTGYYPIRLGDLVKTGYLRSGTTFRSPITQQWYFYAIDDNRTGMRPQAFALGHAGKPPGIDYQLHRGGPLPKGRDPFTKRAWGWYVYRDFGLALFAEDDIGLLPDARTPVSLATYRYGCSPATTGPCDLITN